MRDVCIRRKYSTCFPDYLMKTAVGSLAGLVSKEKHALIRRSGGNSVSSTCVEWCRDDIRLFSMMSVVFDSSAWTGVKS